MTEYISCNICLRTLPTDNFSKASNTARGYQYKCKKCAAEYHSNNLANIKAIKRKYYLKNSEHIIFKSAKWQKNNPEKVKEKNTKWATANPGKHRERVQRRRARISQNKTYAISTKEMNKLYSKPCIYCGATENISMDHVIPIARGGNHSIGNLIPSCSKCNSSKGAKTITEWKKTKREAIGQPTTQ